jgi:hypothetical protein
VWHVDQYDKLRHYGFCIHGAIDGFSRKILWLRVYSTNRDPWLIARYYYETVSLIRGNKPHRELRIMADGSHFKLIYRVSQKKLTPLLFIWISNVSVFFDSPCTAGVPKKTKTIEITNNNLIVRIWMPKHSVGSHECINVDISKFYA